MGEASASEKKCKHCAMMIPKEAKVCPHCRKKQGTSFAVGCLAVVAVVIFISIMATILSTRGPETSKVSDDDLAERAFYKSQEYMKGYLKAPAGADFPYYNSASVKRVAGDGKGTMYEVLSYVDSQNSFGAKIRTNYKCSIVRVHADNSWVMAELKAW